jgi:serine protease Do
MSDPFSQFFFGDQFGGSGSSQSEQIRVPIGIKFEFTQLTYLMVLAQASSMIRAGYILTNQHVIERMQM